MVRYKFDIIKDANRFFFFVLYVSYRKQAIIFRHYFPFLLFEITFDPFPYIFVRVLPFSHKLIIEQITPCFKASSLASNMCVFHFSNHCFLSICPRNSTCLFFILSNIVLTVFLIFTNDLLKQIIASLVRLNIYSRWYHSLWMHLKNSRWSEPCTWSLRWSYSNNGRNCLVILSQNSILLNSLLVEKRCLHTFPSLFALLLSTVGNIYHIKRQNFAYNLKWSH